MKFSSQQTGAIEGVGKWLKDRSRPVYRLFGYAGTGKTTLAKHLESLQDKEVLYGAYTGKAAKVLGDKGCHGARTIHSLIYNPSRDQATGEMRFNLDKDSPVADAGLVIIDECSMVDEKIGKDLLSFGTPILVLGDPFQLPPVKGAGFFTECEPDFMLNEVHRQAGESPILRLATDIRLGQYDRTPNDMGDGCKVIAPSDVDRDDIMTAGTLVVGMNKTRRAYNARMRTRRGFADPLPMVGETLICLQNDKEKNLMNGSIWLVDKVKKHRKSKIGLKINLRLADPDSDRKVDVSVYEHFFQGRENELDWRDNRGMQQFDYGYAITCHKSQGSQWGSVYVFDESQVFNENADRWLYTAVTRAVEKLTVVI